MILMVDANPEPCRAEAPTGNAGARKPAALFAVLLSCASAVLFLDRPADAKPSVKPSANSSANSLVSRRPALSGGCIHGGHNLQGKVKVVDAFPDLKVKVVDAFPDLNVQWVDSFPDRCGRWQRVDSFPDFTIQFVDAFPDLTIREVTSFPGRP